MVTTYKKITLSSGNCTINLKPKLKNVERFSSIILDLKQWLRNVSVAVIPKILLQKISISKRITSHIKRNIKSAMKKLRNSPFGEPVDLIEVNNNVIQVWVSGIDG